MKRFSIIAIIVAMITTGCTSQRKADDAGSVEPAKTLVLYYSQTDATKSVAELIQKALGADIEAIEMVDPYPDAYQATIEQCLAEQAADSIPAIKPIRANLDEYEVVFLGYPIWFGTYARPVMTLLAQHDFAGKKVVPFCTFGSGGLESSAADLRKALPEAEIAEGYGVRRARLGAAESELNRFLIEQGYLAGEIEPLPVFGDERPVTPEDTALFDAACGNYQFPLGTPVTVQQRTVPEGTEYRYTVASTSPQGEPAAATIFVISEPNEDPVFTRVIR